MKIIIIGKGNALYYLCRTFLSKGYEITVIDDDHEECVTLARRLNIAVVYGRGSDPLILEEAGAPMADVTLAVTPNDQDNLVACQLAALTFKVPRVIALANNPSNEEAFQKLGVTAFSTTRILASLIEQRAALEEITNLVPVAQGKVNLTEIVLNTNSPVLEKQLRDISLPKNSLIAVVTREEQPIVPHGNTQLLAGDRIILVTTPENHGQAVRTLTGEAD